MKSHNTIVVSILFLIIGFTAGYLLKTNTKESVQNYNYHTMPDGTVMSGMNMKHTMDGMIMSLEGKQGAELEEAFLQEMIIHHEGAVEMAETLLNGTERPELVKLANDIISAQDNEIEMMKKWQQDWFE